MKSGCVIRRPLEQLPGHRLPRGLRGPRRAGRGHHGRRKERPSRRSARRDRGRGRRDRLRPGAARLHTGEHQQATTSSPPGRRAGERRGAQAAPAPPPFQRNVVKVKAAGKHRWFVPDAYLPAESSRGLERPRSGVSAECLGRGRAHRVHVLLRGPRAARRRGPVTRREAHAARAPRPGRRARRRLPRGTPFAAPSERRSRGATALALDTTAGGYTLFTTIAYSE